VQPKAIGDKVRVGRLVEPAVDSDKNHEFDIAFGDL
jgi:hypothetical protein